MSLKESRQTQHTNIDCSLDMSFIEEFFSPQINNMDIFLQLFIHRWCFDHTGELPAVNIIALLSQLIDQHSGCTIEGCYDKAGRTFR